MSEIEQSQAKLIENKASLYISYICLDNYGQVSFGSYVLEDVNWPRNKADIDELHKIIEDLQEYKDILILNWLSLG